MVYLSVYDIEDNPFQPRRDFSEAEIGSLAESLKTHDMLQPILVRIVNGRHQLISGERRLRAAIQAGWSKIPARIRQADDRLVAELAIVENLQRKDLNAIEKALSFRRYLNEHHATQDELAQRLKIDRSTIANLMRLLELPAVVQDALRGGAITAGHARAMLPLGDESLQIEFCQRIQREGFSVRQTEQIIAEMVQELDEQRQVEGKPRRRRSKSQHVESLENQFKQCLGTRVEIRQSPNGRGKIVIHFPDGDEFERLQRVLLGRPSITRAA
jgi:ParB family chromosome partitioning protein